MRWRGTGGAGGRARAARGLACVLILAAAGCGRGAGGRGGGVHGRDDSPAVLETVGDFAIAPLRADGFARLEPRERALAYYLVRAAIAGRDIYYDQAGRDNLEVRNLLEEILTHPRGLTPEFRDALLRYLKLFWINNGNHYDRTRRKFVPTFTFEELRLAAGAAQDDGARYKMAIGESLDRKLARLRPAIFDPAYEPLLTCKTPPPGSDIVSCSSVNFYDGVTLADLAGFHETHPLNSRVVRRDGRIVEEVWRAGRGDIPAGLYASELRTVIGFLAKAGGFADAPQRAALGRLADFFATGDPADLRAYDLEWVQLDPTVDTINGFIETYKDPRSRKGAWQGVVFMADPAGERLLKALAAEAQYFEDRAPWEDRFKRRAFATPVAAAVDVLVAVGDSGPMPPIGVNLPNDEVVSENHGNRSLLMANVVDASAAALEERITDEFALPEDRDLQARLGETYAAIEEARAELVALYHVFDPRLLEIGALSSPAVAEAACRDYLVHDLSQLRRVREGETLEDDHMRATHLIVEWLRRNGGGVESVRRDGRTYLRLADPAAMRRGVARLLAEVQRIKGEGDVGAARVLLRDYATGFDPALRDEVVARAERATIPSYIAYVMPDIVPVRDPSGDATDARAVTGTDFALQMLRYSGKLPFEEPAAR
jgi:dipeptidyl-peptidase-3